MARHRDRVRRMRHPVTPGLVRALGEEMLADPNVVGYYLGHKYARGRNTRSLALVALVQEKIARRKLDRRHRLPSSVLVQRTSTSAFDLPVDVQELRTPFAHQGAVIGPGDRVECDDVFLGSVGVVLKRHGGGPLMVTTAAHVVAGFSVGDTIQLKTSGPAGTHVIRGTLRTVRYDAQSDYALIEPDQSLPIQNAYEDQYPLSTPTVPGPGSIGEPVYVLTPGGRKVSRLRGMCGSVMVGSDRFDNALLTDHVTEAGDSGSCLVDTGFSPLGLLVGGTECAGVARSAFMPLGIPLVLESADLA